MGPRSAALPWPEQLRATARLTRAGVWTGAMLVGVQAHMRAGDPSNRGLVFDRWYAAWAAGLTRKLGIRLDVSGTIARRSDEPRLILANHRSAADIPILLSLFSGHILSRADLAGWPLIGPLAKMVGTLFVERGSGQSGAKALRAIRTALRDNRTVILFPEGSTFPGDDVRPFFPGVFAAAKGLDVQVVPVGLSYPQGAEWVTGAPFGTHLNRLAGRRDTCVAVTVGPAERLASNDRSAAQDGGKRNDVARSAADHFRGVVQVLVDTSRARRETASGTAPVAARDRGDRSPLASLL